MKLEKFQAAITAALFEQLPISGDVKSFDFSLFGEFTGAFRAGYATLNADSEQVEIVFNLPSYSDSVFLAVNRSDPKVTARVLANLEDYERESRVRLELGDVVLLSNESDSDVKLPFAVILLRTASSLDLSSVPDRLLLGGREARFFLAMPLSEPEWLLRGEKGHDALIDTFVEKDKSLAF